MLFRLFHRKTALRSEDKRKHPGDVRLAYADLILNGNPETDLKAVTECKPLDSFFSLRIAKTMRRKIFIFLYIARNQEIS